MERLEEMKEFLQEERAALLQERAKAMEENTEAKEKLAAAIKELTAAAKPGSLAIAFLRSSYITRSHEFLLSVFEGKPFVEEAAEGVYFSMRPLFQETEDDCEILYKKLREKYIRIFDGEKEELRRWYMDGIYKKCGEVFGKFLKEMEWQDKRKLSGGTEEQHMDVYYGGYMEKVERIGQIG